MPADFVELTEDVSGSLLWNADLAPTSLASSRCVVWARSTGDPNRRTIEVSSATVRRVDSGAYQGYRIPPNYDSLIGKLIVHGKNRNECLMRLRRCLSEFVIDGIETTIPLFIDLVRQPDIVNGMYDIHWLERYLAQPETE